MKNVKIFVHFSFDFLLFDLQKIKVDNVFDIQWDEKTKLADLDWQSSANFLDTISKVWGIKVEKTHKDTYRILGDLIRSQI